VLVIELLETIKDEKTMNNPRIAEYVALIKQLRSSHNGTKNDILLDEQNLGKDGLIFSFTPIIEPEGEGYFSVCAELDIASQGDSFQMAKDNLIEAIELFWETASESEIISRLEEYINRAKVEVLVG
jgi:predicted RNase H-like HicB family nuclease